MGFLCIIMTFTVSIVTNSHTWPDPSFDAIQHTLGSKQFFLWWILYPWILYPYAWNIPLSNGKTENSLLEFDFEAVCPTLDHDLLSQAHIHMSLWQAHIHMSLCQKVLEEDHPFFYRKFFFKDKLDSQSQCWVSKIWKCTPSPGRK